MAGFQGPNFASAYPRTQDIAETAHFLDYSGMLVPNARWNCTNVIVFCDRVPAGSLEIVKDHGPIDWAAWRRDAPPAS